jgi:catechol 2,3-dioxygenase-like lactoylglutathione lyase family enzyme
LDVLSSRVLLRPADFDASVRFYDDVVGLSRSREFGDPPGRGIVYFLGGGELELTETPPGADPGPRPAGFRLWLRVPDAQSAYDRLARLGAHVLAEPARQPWGLIEGSVADPDGVELVIVEVPCDHPMRRDPRSGKGT